MEMPLAHPSNLATPHTKHTYANHGFKSSLHHFQLPERQNEKWEFKMDLDTHASFVGQRWESVWNCLQTPMKIEQVNRKTNLEVS